jgi:uncharacterized membrane protein
MGSGMSADSGGRLVHKHRLEALNDGIYAVAMTLLVLELRIPDTLRQASDVEFLNAMIHLIPKVVAWLLSFFILAVFWMGHQRAFHYVHRVDGGLLWINLVALLFASLMPFSSALIGEHGGRFASQAFYAANMAALALATVWQLHHLSKHPELCDPPLPRAIVVGARFRGWSLVALAAVAVAIAWWDPRYGTMAFVLMFLLVRIARRLESRASAQEALLSDRPFP